MGDNLAEDLNATIASAVNARIEAQVAEAMSGDAVLGQYVQSALRQTVEVNKRDGGYGKERDGGYGKERVTFLSATLGEAIRAATKAAVAAYFAQHADDLEAEVAKALRRNSKDIAVTLIESLTTAAAKPYGVNVAMSLKMPND